LLSEGKVMGIVGGVIASVADAALTALVAVTAPLTGGAAIGITQATAGTDGYVTQAKYNAWDAKITNPMSALGDTIYGGAAGSPTRLPIGAAGTVLKGGATPSWAGIAAGDIGLVNDTVNDVTAARHGFAPKLSGVAGQYLDGQGAWAVPAGVASVYTDVSFNVGGGGGSKNVVHNFGAYPVVQCIDSTGAVYAPTSITHNTLNDFTVVFAGAFDGHILATIGSPQLQLYKTVAADYAVLNTDHHIEVTAAGKTMTLPTAVGQAGRVFHIDNSSAGNITVICTGVETIWGQATQDVPPNSCMSVVSNGTVWRVF
jgi:hypothetical protein